MTSVVIVLFLSQNVAANMNQRRLVFAPFLLGTFAFSAIAQHPVHDIVIYGGTSAGIAAAVQAKRLGSSVVVIEPSDRIGGLTTGGLGQTDIGNKMAIGGIAREFYQQVRAHYEDSKAWKWQSRESYRGGGQSKTGNTEAAMWTFEPSTALQIFESWVETQQIDVRYGERLDRDAGVAITRSIPWQILSIRMESGMTIHGRMFIDASYEGDLMAAANISYHVGREANSVYGESLNGVQVARARSHQLKRGIDPYIEPGNPDSGLLPHIDAIGPGVDGDGDQRVQAYCFRMCLTDHPKNRIPFTKPAEYDELWYELLFRNFEAGETGVPWINSDMPNRKTDTNNRLGFSTDFIGQNYAYPEASYAERAKIIALHRKYQQGLVWTLAFHPRVPKHVRDEVSRWGMCKDEFTDHDGWQQQLYIREARRMVSDYVMSQHDCQGRKEADDPVGLAAYTMDSHNQQRYVDADGQVRNEGDVQVGGFSPYPISYRSIIPKRSECGNLLVPVCLSASHIAFGSIRMEPVFMVLGQSAATAANLAIRDHQRLQELDYSKLREQLLKDKQVLQWTGPKKSGPAPGVNPASLPGVVMDEQAAQLDGFSMAGHTVTPYLGTGYLHDGNGEKGFQKARYQVSVDRSGSYEVRIGYSAHGNRATNVPILVQHAEGEQRVTLDQTKPATINKLFQPIGAFRFEAGATYVIEVSNAGTDGYVILDGVQLVWTK